MTTWTAGQLKNFEKATKDVWARLHANDSLEELKRGYDGIMQAFKDHHIEQFRPLDNVPSDVGTAVQMFRDFCDGVLSHPAIVQRNEYLEVTMSRNYGKVSMSWKMGTHFLVTSPASRSAAYDELYMVLMRTADEWEKSSLGKSLPASQPDGQMSLPEAEEFLCERLEVQVISGRTYCKVTGGKYQKHGVRIWPEVLGKAGINPADVTTAGLDLSGYKATISLKGGKPDKVVNLVKDVGV